MSALDRELLAERTMVVRRHLARVRERLPEHAADLLPATDASDAVILHLWQAVQVVIDGDVGVSALGSRSSGELR